MNFKPLCFFPFLLASAVFPLASADEAPAATVEQLQTDFRKLGFGMFIHYNMATYHGVQWVEGYPSPSTFDPGGKIDTDAWADAAKSAGMTYRVQHGPLAQLELPAQRRSRQAGPHHRVQPQGAGGNPQSPAEMTPTHP